jgi:hypothetical protein
MGRVRDRHVVQIVQSDQSEAIRAVEQSTGLKLEFVSTTPTITCDSCKTREPFSKTILNGKSVLLCAECVPEESEILTNRGFLDLDAYKARAARDADLRVASYDTHTAQLIYETPLQLVEQTTATRTLVELDDAASDVHLLVTQKHDLYARFADNSDFAKISACDVLRDAVHSSIQQLAGAAGGVRAAVSRCSRTAACVMRSVECAHLTRVSDHAEHVDEECVSVDFEYGLVDEDGSLATLCELYGIWLACGALKCSHVCTLSFAPRSLAERARLTTLLDALGAIWHDDVAAVCVTASRLVAVIWNEYCDGVGDDDDVSMDECDATHDVPSARRERGSARWLAWWTWLLDRDAKRAVLAGLRAPASESACDVETESARFRDEVVRFGLEAGYSTHFACDAKSAAWRVTCSSVDDTSRFAPRVRAGDVRERVRTGRVWCFTMPHGFIWTRRVEKNADGVVARASRAVITGNWCVSDCPSVTLHSVLLQFC